ncbi:MAG: type II toxin-antitoxin system RelE/ParE family toxin [Polaromonas sp.]|uniref:type II toxin-antitoxin system RelE/ParE family toxin n=1 Tax=Polaromonas sp. TaxID=1869339 RepID=UPI002732C94F|nr:type II toxin-antitoxin system RelE/ParE family toxin [Polaromonas sp.]MDP2817926.1 type II toxin-antitoxin system RelE/ParE family toxin [Polaromonas sp.]
MQVSFNSEALAEAEEAAHWYRENGGVAPSLAFTQELKRVANLAAQQPGMGSPGLRGTTRLHFKRFPYTLFFRIDGEFVRVLAIAHQSRRPGYWAERR